MKVLLADDDLQFGEVTASALKGEGFEVIRAGDGMEVLRRWQADRPDVVLVNVSIAHPNGYEVCRRIRRSSESLVVLLTGAPDEQCVLQGFASGADDYIPKPCRIRELSWRIRAVSARKVRRVASRDLDSLIVDDVVLDRECHQARRGERRVQLTPIEFQIACALATRPGQVLRFARLIELVWGYDGGSLGSLRHHVSNLRRKLAELEGRPLVVDVVHGAGYVLGNRRRECARGAGTSPVRPAF